MSPAVELSGVPGPFEAGDPRTRLLAATARTIAARGYRAATVAEIVERAAVPIPSFHRYFADIEAAALLADEAILDWLGAQVAASSDPWESPWPLVIRNGVERTLELLAPWPDLALFCASELPRSSPAARVRQRATLARLVAPLRLGRNQARCPAELPASAERAAIGGAIAVLGRRAGVGGGDLRDLSPAVTYFLLVPYLGVAEARRVSRPAQPGV